MGYGSQMKSINQSIIPPIAVAVGQGARGGVPQAAVDPGELWRVEGEEEGWDQDGRWWHVVEFTFKSMSIISSFFFGRFRAFWNSCLA